MRTDVFHQSKMESAHSWARLKEEYRHMSQRHPIQNDRIMFVTTNIKTREPLFENAVYAREAIETLYRTQEMYPFYLYGFVIMPDHIHLLLFVPAPLLLSKIMNVYKGITSLNIGLGSIWQKRFFVRIPKKPIETLRYIHMNPVKAGIVTSPERYLWSSASGKWDIAPLNYD